MLPELGLTGYTCGDLFFSLTTLVGGAERALARVLRETRAPRRWWWWSGCRCSRAAACSTRRRCCRRAACWASCRRRSCPATRSTTRSAGSPRRARRATGTLRLAGQEVPFGTDLLFRLPRGGGGRRSRSRSARTCGRPIPPSSRHAVAGASVILNPSASNDLVGKAEYRRELVTPAVGAHARGLRLRQRRRPRVDDRPRVRRPPADRRERRAAGRGRALPPRRRARRDRRRRRAAARGARAPDLVRRAVHGAAARLPHAWRSRPMPAPAAAPPAARDRPAPVRARRPRDARRALPRGVPGPDRGPRAAARARRRRSGVVLGLSGGLDSTLALLVCARTFDLLGLPRRGILAVTMPGFGTTSRTLDSARRLADGVRRGAARDRHPAGLRAAHQGHRARSEGPRERHLPEPAGARAHRRS